MKTTRLLVAGLLILLAGCQTQPVRTGGDSALDRWVERELVPYLARQLTAHPRFRGEPVALVSIQGEEIQPRIDALTDDLRRRLRDALLQHPGVVLPWEPAGAGLAHPRRAARLDCRPGRRGRYFVGLEFTRVAGGRYRLSVRALDPQQQEWVAGFGRHWEGRLDVAEESALGRRSPDESLRGLRPLPFESDQGDRAAEYLANNLGCLLRRQGREGLRVHLAPAAGEPAVAKRVRALLDNNLSRFGQLRVTDDAGGADIALRLEAQAVAPGLLQLWVGMIDKGDRFHLAGLDTPVYIRSMPVSGVREGRRSTPARTARIAALTLTRDPGAWCGDAPCHQAHVRVRGEGELFLFAHSSRGGIGRLGPGCAVRRETAGPGRERRYRIEHLALPAGGAATLYAILARSDRLRDRLARLLAELPRRCDGVPADGLRGPALERWSDRLDRLLARAGGAADWQAARTP